jgi:hypothetical protein
LYADHYDLAPRYFIGRFLVLPKILFVASQHCALLRSKIRYEVYTTNIRKVEARRACAPGQWVPLVGNRGYEAGIEDEDDYAKHNQPDQDIPGVEQRTVAHLRCILVELIEIRLRCSLACSRHPRVPLVLKRHKKEPLLFDIHQTFQNS